MIHGGSRDYHGSVMIDAAAAYDREWESPWGIAEYAAANQDAANMYARPGALPRTPVRATPTATHTRR